MRTTTRLPEQCYERAPDGARDKFRLTRDTSCVWRDPPEWVWRLIGNKACHTPTGALWTWTGEDGKRRVWLNVYAGYHFSVSVAPNFRRAVPASLPHDWLYENAGALAKAFGCKRADILRLADHWFLAVMRWTGFLFRRTYYVGVRVFGAWFNALFGGNKK
jgi:hypothetical protein